MDAVTHTCSPIRHSYERGCRSGEGLLHSAFMFLVESVRHEIRKHIRFSFVQEYSLSYFDVENLLCEMPSS